MKNKLKIGLLSLFTLFFSCTDLEEEILDEALNEELLSSEGFEDGVLASVYSAGDRFYTHYAFGWGLQELVTDEALIPTRVTDWDDNGVYRELHQFTWTPTHTIVTSSWNELTQGIARSIQAIVSLENSTSPAREQFLAEARATGALYMMHMLDLYGVIVYRNLDNLDFLDEPLLIRRSEAIDFVISEFEASIPNLPTREGNPTISRGRMTQEAARGFLARAYLNRAVYNDPYASSISFNDGDMQQVINLTTQVIDAGSHSFETEDYFAMFDIDNANNSEHIYVIDQRIGVKNGSNRLATVTLSRAHRVTPSTRPFNGACTTPEFLATWEGNEDDPRFFKEIFPQDGTVSELPSPDFDAGEIFNFNRGFLEGQQYGPFLNEEGNDFTRAEDNPSMLIIRELRNFRDDNLVNHTRNIEDIFTTQAAGVRVYKYEMDPLAGAASGGVDIPLLRLSEMYLLRAEARLRIGVISGAISDVNQVRSARGANPIIELDLEKMFNERGYELYWEQVRRSDMIRFGFYDEARLFKSQTAASRRIYPIPQSAIDVNSSLEQNPGY